MEIISFDVFDTLITRKVANPMGIFCLMQAEVVTNPDYQHIPRYIRNNFGQYRQMAESQAAKQKQMERNGEYTFWDIYRVLGKLGQLSDQTLIALSELEIQFEKDNLVPIDGNIQRLKEFKQQGDRVICISDMYLSETVIRSFLEAIDDVFREIPIFVSVTCGYHKQNGKLYEYVRHQFGKPDFSNWTHIGDHPIADKKVPQELGIQCQTYDYVELSRLEEKLLENRQQDWDLQQIIGASKNARLFYDKSLWDRKAFRIGATVGGYLMVPYGLWIVEQAISKGIQRLYFVARDGYVIKQIVDQLLNNNKYDIQTFYLYGSRMAWQLPALYHSEVTLEDGLELACFNRLQTLAELADLIELPEQELVEVLKGKGYQYTAEQEFRQAHMIAIISLLSNDLNLMQKFRKQLKQKYEITRIYLQKEVDRRDENFAFVELSGTGFTQFCLSRLLDRTADRPIRSFYYDLEQQKEYLTCINYSFVSYGGDKRIIIELLSRGMHGQTMKYEYQDEKIVPVWGKVEEVRQLRKIGYQSYIKGLLAYLTELNRHFSFQKLSDDLPRIIPDVLDYISLTPNTEEIDFLGEIPSGVTGREKKLITFAPKLSSMQVKDIFINMGKEKGKLCYQGASLQMSLLRSNPEVREWVKQYRIKNQMEKRFLIQNKPINQGAEAMREKESEELLFLPSEVILYAAGERGQRAYHRLMQEERIEIKAWVDRNAAYYRGQGLPVINFEELRGIKCNHIIIAVANFELFIKVRKELKEMKREWYFYWLPMDNIFK